MGSELVHDDGQNLLAPLPTSAGLWSCRDLELVGDDRLVARFDHDGGAGQLEITVGPKDMQGVFRAHEHCAVRYRGRLPALSERGRAEVAMLVHSIGSAVDQRLAEAIRVAREAGAPEPTLADALGRRRSDARLVFGRDSLLALLAPEISLGADLGGGWALSDVYPSSRLREAADASLELVLDFRRAPEPGRMRIVVGPRKDDRRSFASSAHFALTHDAQGSAEPDGAANLRTLVAFVLKLRDHAALDVVFTDVASDVQSLLLAAPAEDENVVIDETTRVLNLAISSECHQQCAFCSVKELEPARDGGDPLYTRLTADLLSNREAGVVHYRLNGYDPLTYSRVLDILRFATRVGYRRTDVFSPCTTLADPAFCDAVLAAITPERNFHVPLYALEPALHDRCVGREGAHALVMRALENLEARVPASSIVIISVAMVENVEALPALAAFAARKGFRFTAHLPYPSHESRADKFFTSMPRQEAVAEVLASCHRAGQALRVDRFPSDQNAPHPSEHVTLRVDGVAPCVAFRRMTSEGVPLLQWLEVGAEPPVLPGTEYRAERFRHRGLEVDHSAYHAPSVPCPHASKCALATVCSQELLRGYVELHGVGEFQPVSLRELLAAYEGAGSS